MTSTDTIRFTPVGRKNRITVSVTGTSTVGSTTFVHGFRVNANGCTDSQSRENAWVVDPTTVEVVG